MRVALVTHQFFPAFYTGAERLTLNLTNQLARMGHEAIVVTSAEHSNGGAPSYAYEGAWVRTVAAGDPNRARPWLQDRAVVDRLVDILREERSEIVHVLHPMRLPQAFEAAERLDLPVVVHLTDFGYLCANFNLLRIDGSRCPSAENGAACVSACRIDSGPERYAWGKRQLARAAAVVAGCRWSIERYAAEGFDTTNWHHLPWGTDYAIHDAWLDPPAGDELVLGFIGTLLRHKGAHVVVKALQMLPDRPIRLLLYGGSFHEAEYERELRRLAGDDDRIVFAGSYEHADLSKILGTLSAVVIPSIWYENLPMSGLNAIVARVPLITADVGGLQELIDDYHCGFTYAADDPEALAELLARLCDNRALLDDVRRTITLPLSVEEEAWRMEGIYTDCLVNALPA
jgi:glycosyltransferase involved in cell wall biosynthesis